MKKSYLLLLLILIISVLPVFGGGDKESSGAEVKRTVLKVGVGDFDWRYDPAVRWSNVTSPMHINMHDGLVTLTPMKVPYKVEPAVAESWKAISPTVTEFKLRKGVKFWDGSEVTAEDVAWSLNRSIKGEHPLYASYAGRWAYNFEKVEVVDASTVRVFTLKSDPLTLVMLAQTPAAILSKKAYDAAADPNDFFRNPVGCGAYKIVDFKEKQYLKLASWDGYWGKKPPLEKLEFYLIPEVAARITALVNKEVDFVLSIPPDQVSAVEGRKGIKTLEITWDMFHVYALNSSREPLKDPRIRRAMNLAIDRETLNKGLWDGKGIVPTSHQYVGRAGYDPKWKVFEYNPEKAKQLIKEANYDGSVIELDFEPGAYLYCEQAATAVADMWGKVGLKVRMQFVESWTSRKIPEKSNMIRPWSNPMYFPDMLGGFDPHWSPTGWPIADGWNPQLAPGAPLYDRYIKLYDTARYELDEKVRIKAYKELVEMLEYEATPWIILYQPTEYFAMADDIKWEVPKNYRGFTTPFRSGDISFK